MDALKPNPPFVYVTYIATTPQKLWQALTDKAFSQQCWSGASIEAEGRVMLEPTFVPKTGYVTYIAATRDTVWQALTASELAQQYSFGRSIEIEPRSGGSFVLRMPDGRVDVKGKVVEWSPPRRLSVTWRVDWNDEMRTLPECLVTYDIEQAGGAVKLTVSEAHQWDVPDDPLSGGRAGRRSSPGAPHRTAAAQGDDGGAAAAGREAARPVRRFDRPHDGR